MVPQWEDESPARSRFKEEFPEASIQSESDLRSGE